jgi:transposase
MTGAPRTTYDWCAQNDDIAELLTLARTISKWEDEIVAAVLTGVTTGRSEALNRLAKLEARMAYSFRKPASQHRRVRTACTRSTRRRATPRQSRMVTGRQPDPGYPRRN